MKMIRSTLLFIFAAALGVGIAFSGSLYFLKKVRAQSSTQAPPKVEAGETPQPEKTQGDAKGAEQTAPVAKEANTKSDAMADSMQNQAPAPYVAPPTDGSWVYNPTNRRDPFRPYKTFRAEGVHKDKKSVEEKLDPLQKLDLTKISLVGVLWEVKNPKALIRDDVGNIYSIHKNSRVGRRNGYVAVIREGEIVIVESNEEDGKMINETHVFELKKAIVQSSGGGN